MKKLILISGITFVSLTNICKASPSVYKKRESNPSQTLVLNYYNDSCPSNDGKSITKTSLNIDSESFSPETIIAYNRYKTFKEIMIENDKITEDTTSEDLDFTVYKQSMENLIRQSDLIIENNIVDKKYSLYFDKSMEDTITDYESIIESTVTNETKPLVINRQNQIK